MLSVIHQASVLGVLKPLFGELQTETFIQDLLIEWFPLPWPLDLPYRDGKTCNKEPFKLPIQDRF